MLYDVLTRQEMPFNAAADLVYSNLRVAVEGDDTHGYRAALRANGNTYNYYVVRENGAYKLLAVSPLIAPLGRMALERLEAGDTESARRWLDWARMEQRPANSEDPLVGWTFSRFWTAGGQADLADMRTGVALLLADTAPTQKSLDLLLAAQTAARSDNEKLAIDLALARTFSHLERWPQLEEVGARLAKAWPMSGHAFHYQQWARIQQKRWNEVSVASQERLAKYPNDVSALRTQVESADIRGSFSDMAAHMRPLIDGVRATPSEYNEFAWMSLLQQPVSGQAVEAARQAFEDTQGRDPAIAHTLACVYAATGRPREARDLLLKNAVRPGSDELDDAMWFGFGMVAEAYGDAESAREYYSHVEKPKMALIPSTSVYAMAQQRMKRLW